eukprot:6213119-Pleurochrysis_carterae.AAC.1
MPRSAVASLSFASQCYRLIWPADVLPYYELRCVMPYNGRVDESSILMRYPVDIVASANSLSSPSYAVASVPVSQSQGSLRKARNEAEALACVGSCLFKAKPEAVIHVMYHSI